MNITRPLYFDYQATTPVADEVVRKMQPYFSEFFANPHASDHAFGWRSAQSIENATQQVANLIGADDDEIIFTSGATESNNLALIGLAKKAIAANSSRKRILLSAIEHKCIFSIGRVLEEQYGYTVESIPVDQKGHIIPMELKRLLGEDVLLASIMVVNNEIGSIQDIATLSPLIREHGVVFHCDAAQAPIAMNMEDLSAQTDMISLSGHKMYGPKGIGALYIRRDLQNEMEPLIYGGGQQNGLRSGTLPTPLCIGMGAAAQYVGSIEISEKRKELVTRTSKFRYMLSSLSWTTQFYGDECQKRHPGNISIGFQGFNAEDILGVLQPHLAASTGSACTSGTPEPSHVLKAIGLSTEEAESVIRFSLSFETSDQEIIEAIELLTIALKKLSES